MTVGVLALVAIGIFVSCSPLENERRRVAEGYVAAHPELPDQTKEDILAGRIGKGMPREQVVASLGGLACQPPINRWFSDGMEHEFCDIRGERPHRGRILLFRDNRLIGWEEYSH
jgi:hypothetical protein